MLLTILSSSHAPAIQGCLLAPAVIDVGAAPCPEPWSMKTTTMTPQPPSTPPSPALSSAMGQSSTSSETEPSSSSLTLLKAHGSSSSRLAPPPSCWATSCGRCAPPPLLKEPFAYGPQLPNTQRRSLPYSFGISCWRSSPIFGYWPVFYPWQTQFCLHPSAAVLVKSMRWEQSRADD